jgi:hypothetical protein
MIKSTDSDFRVCQITFDTLLEIQMDAEDRGWATRWSSVTALRTQVKADSVILQTLMREERGGVLRAYRCLVLFSTVDSDNAGGVGTIDIDPERVESLQRLDRDVDVRSAFLKVISLATGGVSMVSKK